MSTSIPEYIQGADLPDLAITWKNETGTVIDFSTGWTFTLKLGSPSSTAALTKTTGITGAATSPNVTVAWATTAELNTLDPGVYTLQLKATRTADSKDRYLESSLRVKPAIE